MSTGSTHKWDQLPFSSSDREDTHVSAEIVFWSLPDLRRITGFERKLVPISSAFSRDGERLALAYMTHVEIWKRSSGTGSPGPYELHSLIPKPILDDGHHNSGYRFGAGYYAGSYGSLEFSADGKHLLHVDGNLHIWEVDSGQAVARLAGTRGLLQARYQNDGQILIAETARKGFGVLTTSKGAKIWRLDFDSVLDAYAATGGEQTVLTRFAAPGATALSGVTDDSHQGFLDDGGEKQPGKTDTTGVSVVAKRDRPSTPAEWRELLAGNTASGTSENGLNFHVYHNGDGRMEGIAGGKYWDSGTWEVSSDGKFCSKWKRWRSGNRNCYAMQAVGNDVFRFHAVNKPYYSVFTIRPGDPENLYPDIEQTSIAGISEIAIPEFDLSGKYLSDISTSDSWFFGKKKFRELTIVLQQNGNDISGFDTANRSKIQGILEGNVIKFSYWSETATKGYEVIGEWMINVEGNTLNGTWETSGGASGKWNLTKIE